MENFVNLLNQASPKLGDYFRDALNLYKNSAIAKQKEKEELYVLFDPEAREVFMEASAVAEYASGKKTQSDINYIVNLFKTYVNTCIYYKPLPDHVVFNNYGTKILVPIKYCCFLDLKKLGKFEHINIVPITFPVKTLFTDKFNAVDDDGVQGPFTLQQVQLKSIPVEMIENAKFGIVNELYRQYVLLKLKSDLVAYTFYESMLMVLTFSRLGERYKFSDKAVSIIKRALSASACSKYLTVITTIISKSGLFDNYGTSIFNADETHTTIDEYEEDIDSKNPSSAPYTMPEDLDMLVALCLLLNVIKLGDTRDLAFIEMLVSELAIMFSTMNKAAIIENIKSLESDERVKKIASAVVKGDSPIKIEELDIKSILDRMM